MLHMHRGAAVVPTSTGSAVPQKQPRHLHMARNACESPTCIWPARVCTCSACLAQMVRTSQQSPPGAHQEQDQKSTLCFCAMHPSSEQENYLPLGLPASW